MYNILSPIWSEALSNQQLKWRVKRLKLVIVVRNPSLSVVCAVRQWKTGKMKHYSARASARSGYTTTVPVSQWTNTKNSAPAKCPFSALPAVEPSIAADYWAEKRSGSVEVWNFSAEGPATTPTTPDIIEQGSGTLPASICRERSYARKWQLATCQEETTSA